MKTLIRVSALLALLAAPVLADTRAPKAKAPVRDAKAPAAGAKAPAAGARAPLSDGPPITLPIERKATARAPAAGAKAPAAAPKAPATKPDAKKPAATTR